MMAHTKASRRGGIYTLQARDSWDDETLVARAIEGDPFAENVIYRRHAAYLLNLATRLLNRHADADDVVQETFVVAFKKLASLKNPLALRSWLVRILVRRVRKSLRIRQLKALLGLDRGADDATLEELAVDDNWPHLREELREIDALLKRVPVEWHTAWVLHRVEGLTIRETARAIDRSTATVKRYVTAIDTTLRSEGVGKP